MKPSDARTPHSALALSSLLALGLALVAACSSGNGGRGGSGGNTPCDAACDAQAKGCAQYDVADCHNLCAYVTQPAACASQFDALQSCRAGIAYQCSSTSTFNGKPDATPVDPTQCTAQSDAYAACASQNATTCAGADDAGFCPSVECPCPNGVVSWSGEHATGSSCTCDDTTTCLQHACQ
jgi:hypothetical protein